MKNISTAYGLWALGFVGLCGIHRFYLGKSATGIIWLFTFGFCFLGQLIDAFMIPFMVNEANQKARGPKYRPSAVFSGQPVIPYEYRTPQIKVQPQKEVIKEIVREVIKIKCSYCGALVDQGIHSCPNCGATM